MPQSPGGPVEKKTQKLAMHAGGGTNDRGEKRNVLIVSVLLLIGSNLYAAQQYAAAHPSPPANRYVHTKKNTANSVPLFIRESLRFLKHIHSKTITANSVPTLLIC